MTGIVLSAWVVLSPGWRLAGFRRQHGPLEESLIENAQAENETDLTYWLPSWFFLSVAVMALWCWFFWGASKITESAGSWLRSDPNISIKIVIPVTVAFNIVWLVWLCLINYEKTLLCVAAGTLGFIIVCGLAHLFKGSDRLHFIGFAAVALTVASNFCRMKSSARPQFSTLGFTVAIAGAVAGVLWIREGFAVDDFSADADEHGFLSMLFKKNFFWKELACEDRAELVMVPTACEAEDGADWVVVSTATASVWIS
ncbi:hypothetical protein SEVIR_7G174800v4 [Setaria viridis]|uniref:Uncharacterized protein n=2 Tax=Setaria viridis TaxID=4556 RepID=A0A4U6TV63_SETVI|nr:uncharacterized protein LOC117862594 isoform X1 [Setaria viridis]TKW05424.1 hypothetical protein SEVIR_7G174800v2 [Setaria viridis]